MSPSPNSLNDKSRRRIMLITGEASGDRIASRVIRAVASCAKERHMSIEIFGIGGEECVAEGMECFYAVRDMAVVGFVEVARRFRFFKRVMDDMKRLLDERRPDVLLLIDYPGFNIRLAREAKKRGIKVVYYVSPQVWAWHSSRIEELKQVVDEMLVVFPFEEKIYRDRGMMNAHFVGHPLVERIDAERKLFGSREEFSRKHGLDPTKRWLLVFAGSRPEEVRRLLPVMSRAAHAYEEKHEFQAILVESTTVDTDSYTRYLRQPLLRLRESAATHELMYHADLGILKSGTTTLEAALLELPGVICYRTHPLTFAIGKRLVKLPYIGLANIVIGAKLYPELLQTEMTVSRIVAELESIMRNEAEMHKALQGLSSTLRATDTSLTPSARVAQTLLA